MNLPIVNINNPEEIRTACEKYGFFYVPVNDSDIMVLNNVFTYTKEYFEKSDDEKMKQIMNKDGFGYAPFKKVKFNDSIDLKESFSYRPNEIKCEHDTLLNEHFRNMSIYSKHIFSKIISSIGLPCSDYKTAADPGFNTLTLLHYPSIPSDTQNNNIYGVSPHTDWGLITLLYTTADGLQIYIDGEWLDVPLLSNHFIVNIGDMLEIITDGKYKSTLHRVVVKQEKYSIAFFFEPNLEYLVEPYNKNNRFKPIKYCDYLKAKIDYSYNSILDSLVNKSI